MNATGSFGGDFSSHTIEHSLSAFFNIPYATGLAIIFPAWMQYIENEIKEKLCILGEGVFGLKNAIPNDIINSFCLLFQSFDIVTRLREIGVSKESFPSIAENATSNGKIGRLKKLSAVDVENILELAY